MSDLSTDERVNALEAEIRLLRLMIANVAIPALQAAEVQFFVYEKAHLAKGTPDANAKARTNHDMGLRMVKAIKDLRGG